MVLRRFTDDDGQLHFFDRENPGAGVKRSKPRSLFARAHLYSQLGKDGAKNAKLEGWLAKYEGLASRLIDQIVENARNGLPPGFSRADRRLWDEYFYIQWKRVPELYDDPGIAVDYDDFVADALAKFSATFRPLTGEEIADVMSPEVRKRILHNAKVHSISRQSADVMGALAERGVTVGIVQNPNKSFVVGSRAVVKLSIQGRSDIRDPIVEVWLPVASDVIVGLGSKGRQQLVYVNDQGVRMINQAIVSQSRFFASRSRSLVKSLSSPR